MDRDWTMRPFTPDDLPTLQRIRAAAFAPIFRGFRKAVGPEIAAAAFADAEEAQARHLEEACSSADHHVLVVERAGEIVGFVTFTVDGARRTGELGLNAVAPEHAGRGIGTWMYQKVLARMRALGAETAEVGTGADAAHAPARRAYEKAGFGPAIAAVHLYRRL